MSFKKVVSGLIVALSLVPPPNETHRGVEIVFAVKTSILLKQFAKTEEKSDLLPRKHMYLQNWLKFQTKNALKMQ